MAAAQAQQRQAVAFYQQTILNAFRETNDALIASQEAREQEEQQAKRVLALRQYARLAHVRFDKGLTGYLEVLVADTELFDAELAAVQTRANRYAQLINVYQAMGGGWIDIADAMAPQPRGMVAPPR